VTTSPYYPQASQVERFNRNLVSLTIYHNAQRVRWDENLHSLQMASNTAWHESTGATPASLFLGRELEDPLSLKWEVHDQDLQQGPGESSRYLGPALKQLKSECDRLLIVMMRVGMT
jgi:hypothetical protein